MGDTQPATVLIVDDDRGMVRLIEKSLRREGHKTATATSGQEAIQWLVAQRPDLMLLDLKLQDMEGRELVAHLQDVGRSCPFVIITGQGDERVAVEMMKRGALDYLVKDAGFIEFVPAVVERSLRQVGRERRLQEAEQALKEEHAFVTAVLETTGALIVTLDGGGRIVRFNRACENLTGMKAEEVQGRVVWDILVPEEERKGVREAFRRLCAGEACSEFENHWLTRDGQRRWITWANTVLHTAEGNLEYVIGTGIDVTERKELEAEILKAGEAERARIGQDLHDGICQELAGIELMSQVLAQTVVKKSRPASVQAATIAEHVREAIGQTRRLARGLCPVVVESEGLMAALEELAASTEHMFKVKCAFRCETPVHLVDHTMATHLYRIAQEAVGNAVRHGKAKRIDIGLVATPDRLTLMVKDNGSGIPDDARRRKGMGLRIMSYRAGMIGGTLALERHEGDGKGTTVVCSISDPEGLKKVKTS